MIASLRLQNYRSYRDESFEFDEGVNIIVGPNASGKTNLLEAVLVLSRGSSFRTKDQELINHKAGWARLDGYFDKHTRAVKLQRNPESTIKTLLIDDKPYARLSAEKIHPTVLFEPDHLQLISRGPDQRRDYIDGFLERIDPSFKTLYRRYQRVIAQRNALLKKGRSPASQQLFAWDVRLVELGSQIARSRQELINELNKTIKKVYSEIAGKKSKVAVEYKSQFPVEHYASRLISRLESSLAQDLERGFTSYGPHREDFIFYIGGRPAIQQASRGEIRSLLLALKILELGMVEKAGSQKPIFLLDDVFSELDGSRRRALVGRLKGYQTIITTTDADAVMQYFDTGHKLIAL